jgi:hypothetical protein
MARRRRGQHQLKEYVMKWRRDETVGKDTVCKRARTSAEYKVMIDRDRDSADNQADRIYSSQSRPHRDLCRLSNRIKS